ncbi:MAG: DEAD/DEAH box helicase, partial [Desulfobulbaceae bacterium]|nr:DEAD/DEAH box helicase [Desulfobulbaceae bacterium]
LEHRRTCSTPLFEMSRWRRIGLAPLVKRKFRHFFKVYVADEIHAAANGSTDIGTADQRLLSSIRYSLALTGTLFGGVSGSLFYLLYRRLPELRRLYGFDEKTRWIDHYGLWERQWEEAPSLGEYGASTGIRRRNYRQKELPGVSPSVIRYLLPITLFGSITDLGYSLPPVNERVEHLNMPGELAGQMEFIQKDVLKQILGDIREYGDSGGLSSWFSACRFRPASAWRQEVLQYLGKKGGGFRYELEPVIAYDGWLPKEQRLAEIVRHNMAKGHKTLIFVEQSGTRDIRPRLKRAIEECENPGGLMNQFGFQSLRKPNVGILSADDMPPAKREAWIVHNAPNLDVLIVNPKLVQTGLDLVMFSTLVFFETTVSLPVLWQSMRRVWRLGQDKDVDVIFLAYAGTVEETILHRMGQKKKAAQLLYGKSAAGVLVEVEDDDIQRELIQSALQGKVLTMNSANVANIFTDGSEIRTAITTSPTGSMVATSPTLVVVASSVPMQMTLFGEMVVPQGGRKKRR